MNKINEGTVYLVGAGPGDPDLLTVKANRLLSECDALVYDALISEELLEQVSTSCRRFSVGKRRRNHSLSQDQINKLLMEISKDYSCVVRLKGGDPFLFGRGAEEAEYLVRHNINVEVVPGITSGIAAPAYLGIPLTRRDVASSVVFVTGHESKNKQNPSVNWRALAKATDGIVIYMGMHNLQYIIDELIAGGLDPETPSAIIYHGTLISQKLIKSPLQNLSLQKKSIGSLSPSIVVIGRVIDRQIKECSPCPAGSMLPVFNNLMTLKRENQCNEVEHLRIH